MLLQGMLQVMITTCQAQAICAITLPQHLRCKDIVPHVDSIMTVNVHNQTLLFQWELQVWKLKFYHDIKS